MIFTLVSLEDRPYLLWQLQVQIYNMKKTQSDEIMKRYHIVILYTNRPSSDAQKLALSHNVILINLLLLDKIYIDAIDRYPALVKSLALHQFQLYMKQRFSKWSKGSVIFLIDPDVIFTRSIESEFGSLVKNVVHHKIWYMTNCSDYLDYNFLRQWLSKPQLKQLAKLCGIDLNDFRSYINRTGGCQYLLPVDLPPTFALEVFRSAIQIFDKLQSFNNEHSQIGFVWSAEMLAFFFHAIRATKEYKIRIQTPQCFDQMLSNTKYKDHHAFIIHLSGDIKEGGYFDKTLYWHKPPWDPQHISTLRNVTKKESASFLYLTWLLRFRLEEH